ncbi:homeobox protein vent1-like [Pseudophryne corroboree]|uniref:homeobox protein vent1-like n=1 Tax=Pseudophryne corroboree TaxID=495146 RepID=UPI0030820D48
MDRSFASVEWLSQSSRNDTAACKVMPSLPAMPTDSQSTFYTWSPVMRPVTKIAHVAPYPGTQRQTYLESNYASPQPWDNHQSFNSSDCEVSHYRTDSPRLPFFTESSHKDFQASQSPTCSGQSGKVFANKTQDSTSSQEFPTSSQEVYEKPADKTNLTENIARTGCSPSTDSGYDSETSQSGSTTPIESVAEESSDTSDEESKMGRRLRTAFTTDQISTLENTFQKHRYLGASERRKLAAKLLLSEVQIKTWFQNRRMKHKREIQEGRQGQFHPAHFYSVYGYPAQPIPAFQYMQPGKQFYTENTLVDPISANYPSPLPAIDTLHSFNSPPVSLMYLPQQTVMPPNVRQREHQFVRY